MLIKNVSKRFFFQSKSVLNMVCLICDFVTEPVSSCLQNVTNGLLHNWNLSAIILLCFVCYWIIFISYFFKFQTEPFLPRLWIRTKYK